MSVNAKKLLMTRELHETIIVRSGRTFQAFCTLCSADSVFISLDSAVSICDRRVSEIIHEIEAGNIHARETASRHLLICQNSLST